MTSTTPTQRRALLIVNPISGTSSKEGLQQLAQERLCPAGYDLEVVATSGPGDATEIARRACDDGFDTVIAAGGDGTVNETAMAMCGRKAIFGIIPCGSGNGLARHLNIPVDAAEALDVIVAGHHIAADNATVNGRPFFCTFGVGFDAAVSEDFARRPKRGKLMYVRSALATFAKYHPQTYTISANGHVLTEKAFLVAVCNASQYGNNAYIAPEASITDGLLDVTIVHSGPLPSMALMGLDMMTGYINRNTLIHTLRTSSLTITRRKPGPAHIDGEPVNFEEQMEIKCHPGVLNVFTPGEQTVRPLITPATSFIRDVRLTLRHFLNGE